jgi:hypothetical protein
LSNRETAINDQETKMYKELQFIKSNIRDFQSQINENKYILNQNESIQSDKLNRKILEDQEITQIRGFLKNEYFIFIQNLCRSKSSVYYIYILNLTKKVRKNQRFNRESKTFKAISKIKNTFTL